LNFAVFSGQAFKNEKVQFHLTPKNKNITFVRQNIQQFIHQIHCHMLEEFDQNLSEPTQNLLRLSWVKLNWLRG